MTIWADLPNAAVIDAILADVKARPDVWRKANRIVRHTPVDAAFAIAWRAVRSSSCEATRSVVRNAALFAAGNTVWTAAWSALCALVEWPESAALLDLTPDALRTIIDTCEGDVRPQAVLLLPAVIARHTP